MSMKNYCFLLVILVGGANSSSGLLSDQDIEEAPPSITLDAPKLPFAVEGPIRLHINVKNTTKTEFAIVETRGDGAAIADFRIKVRYMRGEKEYTVDYNKAVYAITHADQQPSSALLGKVPAGVSFGQDLSLPMIPVVSVPGRYFIKVSRTLYKGTTPVNLISNEVEFIVEDGKRPSTGAH